MINQISDPSQIIELFTINTKSTKSVDEIAEKMPDACESYNFSLLKEYNYHEIVESKGFPIERKVFVFEICRAKMASEILTIKPDFSIFMPCRISVYEQDGSSVISTMNMSPFIQIFKNNQSVFEETSVLFETILKMIESLK